MSRDARRGCPATIVSRYVIPAGWLPLPSIGRPPIPATWTARFTTPAARSTTTTRMERLQNDLPHRNIHSMPIRNLRRRRVRRSLPRSRGNNYRLLPLALRLGILHSWRQTRSRRLLRVTLQNAPGVGRPPGHNKLQNRP